MQTVNQKNNESHGPGTYGTVQYGDYTATGLQSYYYSGTFGELPTCLIMRDPNRPTMWCIRNKEGNPINGCAGSFSGNGNGSSSAEKRWKDWCYAKANKKAIEVIT